MNVDDMLEKIRSLSHPEILSMIEYLKNTPIKATDADVIYSFLLIIEKLNRDVQNLKVENESLKNHIQASPDGELYFQAREHYNSINK